MQRGVIKRLGDQTVDVQLAGSAATLPGVLLSGQIDRSALAVGAAVLVDLVDERAVVLHTLAGEQQASSSDQPLGSYGSGVINNALLADGTVPLMGNLAVAPGITVDGYDISVLGQAIDNLQAADTIARTGWTAFSHSTHLVATITASATEILVRNAIFELYEQITLSNTNGEIEFMRINSAATQTVDSKGAICYRYTVVRRVQTSPNGLNIGWAASTLVNGLTKRGYITIDNRHRNSLNAPNIQGAIWMDDPPTIQERVFRFGGLYGILGVNTNDFGVAIGNLDTQNTYLLFNASREQLELKNVDYKVIDLAEDQVARIYGKNEGDRLAGDYDFGKLNQVHNSFYGNEPTWGVYRGVNPIIEINEGHSYLRDLFTIGNFAGARIDLGELNDTAIFALRDKYGVAKMVARTSDISSVYVHIGNPPPEDHNIWFDSDIGEVNVNGHVTVQSMDVRGRATFAETGEFMIVDPDDPGRFGVITPRGQYAYTTDSLGVTHLIRVDAWGPLVLEDVLGSGTWRTWVGGSQVFGDPRYRHFRIERGATARAGMFNGEIPVAYMDQTGKGYFTGEVTMESGIVNGDVLITDGGVLTFDAISGKFNSGGIRWEKSGTEYLRIGTQVDLGSVVGNVIDSHTVDLSLYSDGNIYIIPGAGQQAIIGGMSYGESGSNYTAFSKDGDITLVGAATFTTPNGIVGPTWRPASDSTTALKVQNAAGTADILTVDTTGRRLNINSATSNAALTIQPYSADDSNVYLRNSSGTLVGAIVTGASSVSFSGQGSADFQFVTASGKGFIFKQIAGIIAFRDYQDYEAARATDAEWAFNNNGNPSFDVRIRSATLSHLFFADGSADRIGVGASSPDSIFHVQLDDAATNSVSQLLTLSHNTSGTAAAGYGSRVLWELESSTTADQSAAALDVAWTNATHATRTAKAALSGVRSGMLYELAAFSGAEGVVLNDTGESWADFRVEGDTASHLLFVDASADAVGVGTSAPGARFHAQQTSGDAAIRDIVRITHNSTGTPGTGFGAAIALALESSTTEDVVAGRLAAAWATATHASYAGDLIGYATDAAGDREGWRVRASGSAPMLGLFGAAPVLQPTTSHAAASFTANSGTAVNDASTFDGYTIKQVVKALRDLGVLT